MKWKLSVFREPFKSHKVGEDATELRPDMGPQRAASSTQSDRTSSTNTGSKRAKTVRPAADSGGRSAGGTGTTTRPPSGGVYGLGRGRKVIVKARYRKHQAVRRGGRQRVLAAHVRYLGRPNATELARPEAFFTARDEACDAAEIPTAWAQDRHHWRIILSPEDGDQLDLRRYVRGYVERLERELDTPLEWIAVTHHNTNQPHAHLLIRGHRGDGRDLIIPREMVQDGLREWAEELATLTLGIRSEADADAYLNRQATARRPTQLDALLESLATPRDGAGGGGGDDASDWREVQVPRDWSPESAGRHHLKRRLAVLAEMRLAERTSPPFRRATWRLRGDFVAQLEALSERSVDVEPTVNTREIIAEASKNLQPEVSRTQLEPSAVSTSQRGSERQLSNSSRGSGNDRDDDRGLA